MIEAILWVVAASIAIVIGFFLVYFTFMLIILGVAKLLELFGIIKSNDQKEWKRSKDDERKYL